MRRVIITWSERHERETDDNTVVIVYPNPLSIPKMVLAAMRMRPNEISIRMKGEDAW